MIIHNGITGCILGLCLTTLPAMSAFGADAAAGKTLHDKNCVACHDNKVYTRADRRIKSASSLRKQVKRCELSQGLKWFDNDIDDVAAYLNAQYYHFE